QRAADVPHQLDHVVFADVDHVQRPRLALEDLARDRLADGAGAADDQEAAGLHQAGEFGLVAPDVGVEERRGAADQVKNVQARNFGNSLTGTLDGRFTTRASSQREFSRPSCWQRWNMGRRDIRRQTGRVITSRLLVYCRKASRSSSEP